MQRELPDDCPSCGSPLEETESHQFKTFNTALHTCQGDDCGRRYSTHSQYSVFLNYDKLVDNNDKSTNPKRQMVEILGED